MVESVFEWKVIHQNDTRALQVRLHQQLWMQEWIVVFSIESSN
jgi:hypothetical protein